MTNPQKPKPHLGYAIGHEGPFMHFLLMSLAGFYVILIIGVMFMKIVLDQRPTTEIPHRTGFSNETSGDNILDKGSRICPSTANR